MVDPKVEVVVGLSLPFLTLFSDGRNFSKNENSRAKNQEVLKGTEKEKCPDTLYQNPSLPQKTIGLCPNAKPFPFGLKRVSKACPAFALSSTNQQRMLSKDRNIVVFLVAMSCSFWFGI